MSWLARNFKMTSAVLCVFCSLFAVSVQSSELLPGDEVYTYQLSDFTPVDANAAESWGKSPVLVLDVDRDSTGVLEGFTQSMSSTQDDMSERWFNLVDGLDRVLAGDVYDADSARTENNSYLKLTLSETIDQNGGLNTDVRVRARVDLPNTSKRWQLLFDSEDAEDESLEDRLLNKEVADSGLRLAALQWVTRQSDRWKDSFRIGVRSIPLDPFIRFRSSYTQPLEIEDWRMDIDNSVYFSREDKLRWNSSLAFVKTLDDRRSIVNKTQLNWRDAEDNLESVNVTSYSRVLDDDRRYSYSAGVIANNRPSSKINNYFLRGSYSQRLYQDWLYADVVPLLEFPRGEDFKATPSLNVKIHAYLK